MPPKFIRKPKTVLWNQIQGNKWVSWYSHKTRQSYWSAWTAKLYS